MKAVITTGGKQYYVEEGSVIYVEKLGLEEGSKVEFTDVLMVDDKVGTPYLNNVQPSFLNSSIFARSSSSSTSKYSAKHVKQ